MLYLFFYLFICINTWYEIKLICSENTQLITRMMWIIDREDTYSGCHAVCHAGRTHTRVVMQFNWMGSLIEVLLQYNGHFNKYLRHEFSIIIHCLLAGLQWRATTNPLSAGWTAVACHNQSTVSWLDSSGVPQPIHCQLAGLLWRATTNPLSAG